MLMHGILMFVYASGELSGPGAELLIRFHTSKEERKRYTILTHGDTDTVVALLGKLIQKLKISFMKL